MADSQVRDAADLFTKQTTAINSLWQNYSAVTGALIGLSVSGIKDPNLSVGARLAASVAFAMFSYGNWVLIRQACTIQMSAKEAISDMLIKDDGIAPAYGRLLQTLIGTVNSARISSLYHFTIDAAVFLALWVSSIR